MFGFLTDSIENALDVGESLLTGRKISKRQIANLVDTGLSIASIAILLDVGEDVVMNILEEDE